MKVIRVVAQKNGKTVKIKGDTITPIEQIERRYAVETIYDVIAKLSVILEDDEELIAVHEEHPAISLL